MTQKEKDPTNQEILMAINTFAGNVATKDDIANMATKDDIIAIRQDMATKDDISNMATKDDIRKLEQGQEEIMQRLDNVPYRFELTELETRVDRLEAKI